MAETLLSNLPPDSKRSSTAPSSQSWSGHKADLSECEQSHCHNVIGLKRGVEIISVLYKCSAGDDIQLVMLQSCPLRYEGCFQLLGRMAVRGRKKFECLYPLSFSSYRLKRMKRVTLQKYAFDFFAFFYPAALCFFFHCSVETLVGNCILIISG